MKAILVCVGDKIGRLTVLSIHPRGKVGTGILVKCDCGEQFKIGSKSLGGIKSCGCLRRDGLAVGEAIRETKRKQAEARGLFKDQLIERRTWYNMLKRCYNKDHPQYPKYGGRGIRVSTSWRSSFSNFLKDMGKRPGKEFSIERLDNNKGYCKSNCIWTTRDKQNRNHSRNHNITYNGQTKCLTDWAKEVGLSVETLRGRLNKMTIHNALYTPVYKCRSLV